MNEIVKHKAIKELELHIEQISELDDLTRLNNLRILSRKYSAYLDELRQKYEKWKRDIEISIKYIFGEESINMKHFKSIQFGIVPTGNNTAVENNYMSGIKSTQVLLESFIDEIDRYWSDEIVHFPIEKETEYHSVKNDEIQSKNSKPMKVFISHSKADEEISYELVKVLERLGCTVFFSSKSHTNSIKFGKNFYKIIKKEIEDSDYILAMLSNKFYQSIPCQIEMGISFAFNKEITPVGIEKNDYKSLLKGIFTTNDRLASIYKDDDVLEILALVSDDSVKISDCVKDIMLKINNISELSCEVREKKEETTKSNSQNEYLEELIKTGELNINECIFLKYIFEKRRYKLEWGWQTQRGIDKLKEWIDSSCYYLEGDLIIVYEDIINHFDDLGLLVVSDFTSEGNVKLYGFKPEYAKQLALICNINFKIINDVCNKQLFQMPF